MLRRLFVALTVVPWFFLQGCVSLQQKATNVIDMENVDMKAVSKMKKGDACINRVLLIFSWGDQLITTAANNGKISKVKFIENRDEEYLIFGRSCVVAYGE